MPRADLQLTIGGLAARAGFTPKAVRYYERIGLLPAPPRRPSGYRAYAEGDLARLDFIAKAKRLGLSLEEIRDILALREAGSEPCVHVLAVIERHLDETERAIDELTAFRLQLRRIKREARQRVGRSGVVCGIIEHAARDVAIGERARVALQPSGGGRRRTNDRRER